VSLSAILISATVTVFAFAVGEAIAPALNRAVKNVLLSPFVLAADIYRNRRDVFRFLYIAFAWVAAWVVAMFVFHGQF
jgi:hypothetical protein